MIHWLTECEIDQHGTPHTTLDQETDFMTKELQNLQNTAYFMTKELQNFTSGGFLKVSCNVKFLYCYIKVHLICLTIWIDFLTHVWFF